jgi:hypothetical protein
MIVQNPGLQEWAEKAAEEFNADAERAEVAAQATEPPAAKSWGERAEQLAAEWDEQGAAIEAA